MLFVYCIHFFIIILVFISAAAGKYLHSLWDLVIMIMRLKRAVKSTLESDVGYFLLLLPFASICITSRRRYTYMYIHSLVMGSDPE